MQWIKFGDCNSKFLHMSTLIRRKKNGIGSLKGDDGSWITDVNLFKNMVVPFYQKLYTDEGNRGMPVNFVNYFSCLTDEPIASLMKPVTPREVKDARFSMGAYKAPGDDGFQPLFYQKFWDVVGPSLCCMVLKAFRDKSLPQGINHTLIKLIPKVPHPESLTQLRPISLCNVSYKTITKVIVDRLKTLLPTIIAPTQCSFVPGRQIIDNIVIMQEVIHSMRRKKGKRGMLAVKVYLEKAYDRLRWDFLRDTLHAVQLPEDFVALIMSCITSSSMQVMWNGGKTERFFHLGELGKVILSPYIFVFCMERLAHRIEVSVQSKKWRPINLSREGLQLSHLFFADDLVLFAEASMEQVGVGIVWKSFVWRRAKR